MNEPCVVYKHDVVTLSLFFISLDRIHNLIMAPHGNGPPINSSETNQKFYVFSENDSSVK